MIDAVDFVQSHPNQVFFRRTVHFGDEQLGFKAARRRGLILCHESEFFDGWLLEGTPSTSFKVKCAQDL